MSLNLNGNVTGIYLGSAKADAVYLGNVKVFEDSPVQETVTIGGRAYPVVTIGTQKWMAENLDWKFDGLTVGSSGTSDSNPLANYYSNNETTYGENGNKYGLLYNLPAAKYLDDNKSSLIPGWHVPTSSDFETLFTSVGGISTAGYKLRSTTGWYNYGNGDGSFSFEAFPTGYRQGSYGNFFDVSHSTYFWSSTAMQTSSTCYSYGLYYNRADIITSSGQNPSNQYSIRLVKDT